MQMKDRARQSRSGQLRSVVVLLWITSLTGVAQVPLSPEQRSEAIEFAKKAAVDALNFDAGDRQSLIRAQHDFTPEGWSDYMKWQSGFLDAQGAPTYTSRFVPSGEAIVTTKEGDAIHVRIPGALTQSARTGRTAYKHAAIDVTVAGEPLKIRQLRAVFTLAER